MFLKQRLFIWGSIVSTVFFNFTEDALARAGGGGSSSGGGGSGGGGLIWFIIVVIIAIYGYYAHKKKIEAAKKAVAAASGNDAAWDHAMLTTRVQEVFHAFQKAWSELDVTSMESLLTPEYRKRMVLELSALQSLGRRNDMRNVKLFVTEIYEIVDHEDNAKDTFIAHIKAQADDFLLDTNSNATLYKDSSNFTEFWHFAREGNGWRLDLITQSTEDPSKGVPTIKKFCVDNGFYYDADFGWLMMPNKGVLFKKTNFLHSDINNHVIGYYRNLIVELYTFVPKKESTYSKNYLVAQANLPIHYQNILIRKRRWFSFAPKGLRRVPFASVEFDKKFDVFAHPQDQVNSLELLAPDFMAIIYDLPFEMNIEIVGQYLYFYTRDLSKASYSEMFKILSRAFDEMKM